MRKVIILFLLALFVISGCTRRMVDFTIISTKNLDLTKGASFERGKSRVEGEDMVHWIIFIPTGVPDIKECIDKAIESVPGCVALLDGVLYSKFWWIPYIYGQQAFLVEGTPLIDPSLVQNIEEIPAYGMIELQNDGEIKKIESISSEEYFALKDKIIKEFDQKKFKNSKEL